MEALNAQYITYDDHPALGQDVPSIASLNFVTGEKITSLPGGNAVSVIHWGAKFDKGGSGPLFTQMSKLKDANPAVTFLAVFTDPEIDQIKRFLEKKEFTLSFPACHDEGKTVQTLFKTLCKVAALPIPAAFIVKGGKVVWVQVFSQNYQLHNSNFAKQLAHVVAGEPLESAGKAPAVEEDSSSEEVAAAADGAGDDMALF